jgi:hypothetical protein
LQPAGYRWEQEGRGHPCALPSAQGLQEDPCQARQGAREEVQRQGELQMLSCSVVIFSTFLLSACLSCYS